jgi:hypothetical protein
VQPSAASCASVRDGRRRLRPRRPIGGRRAAFIGAQSLQRERVVNAA